MQDGDRSNSTQPPDLLRRFVPTPVKAMYRVGRVRIVVQTNDFALLPALPFDTDPARDNKPNLEWTLVRDADSHGPLAAPMLLTSGTLTTVAMGSACLVGLDHERRELLGFIGADIDARTHQEYLVPLLCRLTDEVLISPPSSAIAAGSKEFSNG